MDQMKHKLVPDCVATSLRQHLTTVYYIIMSNLSAVSGHCELVTLVLLFLSPLLTRPPSFFHFSPDWKTWLNHAEAEIYFFPQTSTQPSETPTWSLSRWVHLFALCTHASLEPDWHWIFSAFKNIKISDSLELYWKEKIIALLFNFPAIYRITWLLTAF